MEDQIKKEVASQIDALQAIKYNSLEQIILNSEYRVLSWQGESNGVNLDSTFNNTLILGRKILIKSIKLVPYALVESDVFFNRTLVQRFTVPVEARLINVVDNYATGAIIRININGKNVIFPSVIAGAHFMDTFIDNIYYLYKSFVSTIDVQITGSVYVNLDTGAIGNALMKVIMECYLF